MNTLPVEVSEVAFEGNFVNIHARGEVGGAYMAQVRNEPTAVFPDVGASSCISASPATPAWCSADEASPGTEEKALGTMIRRSACRSPAA